MITEMIDCFMETVVRWTFICIFVTFWALGVILIWKWFIRVLRHMVLYLFPKKRKKNEVKDNV